MKTIALGLSAFVLVSAAAVMADHHGAERPDGDGHATVTRADMQTRAGTMFDRMDANKDGKLDPADREAHMAAKFDRIDSNRNGAISREEFMAHHGPMSANGEHEGYKGHGGGGHGGKGAMGMMMARMADANKDGAVSRDEFMAAANQRFERADANRDGQITPAERRVAHQAMRQHKHDMMQEHGSDRKE